MNSKLKVQDSELRDQSVIRILFLIDKLVSAGTQTNLLEIVRHLDRTKFEPKTLALGFLGGLFGFIDE